MKPISLSVAVGFLFAGLAHAAEPAGIEFFEKSVRPVFVEHCYECHSATAKAIKGGLRLDTPDAMRKGGDSGPVVIPGKPGDSLLVKAIRHTDDMLKMPPKSKLPPAAIAAVEKWIATGAAFPTTTATVIPAAPKHWSFQPIRNPKSEIRNGIDAIVLAKLQARGLSPSPPADRRTLIRRVYFDLIGLPPTWDEVRAFEADNSPTAFAKIVERLLASPRYGERWARHWLDVARYADTKDGVLMYGDDRVRPFAYTYRDYVIRAFNEDLPFDRFVHEQLAADQIEPKLEPWRLAAMGFLTLGRQFDNNIHDMIDDKIDTTTRGFLGLTVACARCHDHKYDPIPTADYYSLYGVFASSEEPNPLPPLDPAQKGPAEFEKQYAAKLRDIQQTLDSQYATLAETARSRLADYLVHVATIKPDPLETAIFFLSLAPEDLRPPIIARWRHYLSQHAQPDDPVFGPWAELFALPDEQIATQAVSLITKSKANPLVREALEKAAPKTKADVARAYGDLLKRVYDESKAKPPTDDARRQLLAIVTGRDSPAFFPKTRTWNYMSRMDKDAFGGKQLLLDKLAVKEPNAPPRAMSLVDASQIYDPCIFIRGNASTPGAAIPRRFLAILSGKNRTPFPHGSGRLDLAKAITDASNPLTARVIANRVWMHHFGEPLVDTPNDFGLRCAPPTQIELLDYLAATLQRDGWSLKSLHRRIVMSQVYQQASFDRPECRASDPDNRLLWRANRRRLDLEAMRDSLLTVSGRIDHRLYGRPGDAVNDPKNARRTVYGMVDRQSLPGVYRAFDFASPDQSAERRPQTTVPLQALFAMNSPFVLEQAKAVADRTTAKEPAERVQALYRSVLMRSADAEEVTAALAFVAAAEMAHGPSKLTPWQQYAQVLMLTNEFMFVD